MTPSARAWQEKALELQRTVENLSHQLAVYIAGGLDMTRQEADAMERLGRREERREAAKVAEEGSCLSGSCTEIAAAIRNREPRP